MSKHFWCEKYLKRKMNSYSVKIFLVFVKIILKNKLSKTKQKTGFNIKVGKFIYKVHKLLNIIHLNECSTIHLRFKIQNKLKYSNNTQYCLIVARWKLKYQITKKFENLLFHLYFTSSITTET